ncbi:uncharacterized protein LOC120340383 [Styela clava]
MKIPIRHSFIGLILLMEACLLIKGEKCWMPMVCDGQPTWRDVKNGQCTKDEEKALEALTEQLHGMKSELHQLKKTMEKSETNSVLPSVASVKETTTPSVATVKETTTPSVATVKKTTTPSVVGHKEATTNSVVGVKETTTPNGYKDKKTSSTSASTAIGTSPWSTKEAFFSTFRPQTTKVEQSTVKCDVTYKKKCYRAIVYDVPNVTFTDAKAICKSMNGKPANIYDLKHYQLLLPYLRSLIPAGWTYINIWTGMEYKNNQLLLSNGRPITIATEVWFPSYPGSDTFRTNVGVRVDKDQGYAYQGMFNNSPSYTTNGVICEI